MPLVKYSLARLGLFLVVFAVLYAVGLRNWLLWVLTLIIALCIAYLAFSALDRELGAWFENRRVIRQERRRAAGEIDDFTSEDAAFSGDGAIGDGLAAGSSAEPDDQAHPGHDQVRAPH